MTGAGLPALIFSLTPDPSQNSWKAIMINAVVPDQFPKAPNGLTLPLSKSLASQELAKHRAMVAVELEVLAKKMDRFGWERDRNTLTHDRLVIDWMDALQDFPLDEIRAACREAVKARPNAMPNEGHVLAKIMEARAVLVRNNLPEPSAEHVIRPPRISAEMASKIIEQAGFRPRKFGGSASE
jgi:hypothetical protein